MTQTSNNGGTEKNIDLVVHIIKTQFSEEQIVSTIFKAIGEEGENGNLIAAPLHQNWVERSSYDSLQAAAGKLAEAQSEYIKFLGKVVRDNAIFMHVHGMGASEEEVQKGIALRNKIAEALTNYEQFKSTEK